MMNKATALTRLRGMVAADAAPTLTNAELEALLTMMLIADSSGVAPSETGYIATWDLNRAACEGWRWKAGKVAGLFDFNADGAQYNRSQMLAMCEKMVAQYQRRVLGSAPLYASIAAANPDTDDEA